MQKLQIWCTTENLKNLRISRNMSQRDLAEAINAHRSTISRWESGKSFPNEEERASLAKALQVPEVIVAGEEDLRATMARLMARIVKLEQMAFGELHER